MKIPSHYDADIFFCPWHASWGWATWRSKWEGIDWKMKHFDRLVNNPEFKVQYEKTGNDKVAMLIDQKEGKIRFVGNSLGFGQFFKKQAMCIL